MNFEARRDPAGIQVASSEQVAREIRDLRRKQHLSLEELAARSGVSKSMISKIERAESSPSTTTLSRLAEALGVTFTRLIGPEQESEVLVIPADRQPILRDEESGYTRRCLSPVLPGRGLDWVLNTLPPGAKTGDFVPHRRGFSEYVFVLKGLLRVTVGDRVSTLEAGDSIFYEANARHAFENDSDIACEFFLIIDPPRFR